MSGSGPGTAAPGAGGSTVSGLARNADPAATGSFGGALSANRASLSPQDLDDGLAVGLADVQDPATRADNLSLFLGRGSNTLSPGELIHCTSLFCRTHLRQVASHPTRINIARDRVRRWRTFDDVIRAAEAGNADAEFMVAEVLSGGHGVPADPRRAAVWYARAAEHGSTLAVAQLNRLRASLATTR